MNKDYLKLEFKEFLTKKGNYKPEILDEIEKIINKNKSKVCPNCNGKGETRHIGAFGESELCRCNICKGSGKI